MPLTRVHELAQHCGVTPRDVLAFLATQGCNLASASSTVDDERAHTVRRHFGASTPKPAGIPRPIRPSRRPIVAPAEAFQSRPSAQSAAALVRSELERDAEALLGPAAAAGVRKAQARAAKALEKPSPSRTSLLNVEWADYLFDREERDRWIGAGMALEQASVAAQARQAGLTPDDLRSRLGGRTVWERLQRGDDPKRLRELLDHDSSKRRTAEP